MTLPLRRFDRSFSALLLALTLAGLTGCGSAKHEVKFVDGFKPAPSTRVRVGQVTDAVTSPEALEARKKVPQQPFDVSKEFRAQLEKELDRAGLSAGSASAGAAGAGARNLTIDATVVDYWPGSAFTRWLVPGAGKTVLSVQCKLMDGGREVGTATVRRTVDAGGAYTANAWRSIFQTVAADVAKDLKKQIKVA